MFDDNIIVVSENKDDLHLFISNKSLDKHYCVEFEIENDELLLTYAFRYDKTDEHIDNITMMMLIRAIKEQEGKIIREVMKDDN